MNENNYALVTTVQGIHEYIGGSHVAAFDFETSPDDAYRDDAKAALDPARSHIVGCSFSVAEHTGIYVPVAHLTGPNINGKAFFKFLEEFLTSTSILKIAHNISFESQMAYHLGIVIQAPVYDTICASQLSLKSSYEFRKLSDSGLKKLAAELCGEPLPSFSDVTDGRHFDELNPNDYETVRYGAADSDYALRLYHIFNNWFDRFLPRHRYLVEEIESPTAVYLGIMHHNGVPVDLPLMMERKREAESEMERIRGEIKEIIGDVDIGSNCSTQAFKNYLYNDLGLPVLKTTETNREAADDMSMQMLKEWCDGNKPELSPLFTLVQEYRKWGKIMSTYIVGYLKHLNPVTGCIHPDMFALSTDTGRMNCRNPNCQNMPRKTNDPIGVRSFIKAPEGHLILSLDYSQIELRVGSFYCRDEVMLDTYRKNGDIHAATTSVIFGVTYEEAQDKHRAGLQGAAHHRQERELRHLLRPLCPRTAAHIEVQGRGGQEHGGMPGNPGQPESRVPWAVPLAGRDEGCGGKANVYGNLAGTQAVPAEHPQQRLGAEILLRAVRAEHAHPGHRRRHPQAGHHPNPAGAS